MDDTDYVIRALKNVSINRPDTSTPYMSPLIKKNYNTLPQVPPTPYTPYVPPKAVVSNTPTGKENKPDISVGIYHH